MFSYVRRIPAEEPLANLRYDEVTSGCPGVVILAREPQFPGCFYYEYEGTIRSTWHNENKKSVMLEAIEAENIMLKNNPNMDRKCFRAN